MRPPKAVKIKVYYDNDGKEHCSVESWEKAQKIILGRKIHDEFVQKIKELPSVKACCTRTGINDMSSESLLRLIVQDLHQVREVCTSIIPRGEKYGVVNQKATNGVKVTPLSSPAQTVKN